MMSYIVMTILLLTLNSVIHLMLLPRPNGPWEEVTMDMITGLPPCKRGDSVYDAILVVVDRYTKMARYIPTSKTLTAIELADIFFQEIVCQYGTPKGIVSDRGSIFTSSYWSEICYQTKIKRRLSTAFHPQTDGQTERQNQTLEHYLHCYCMDDQNNWVNLLPLAEFAYINAKQATLECSPFYVMTGYNAFIHYDVEDNAWEGEVPAAKERVKKLHSVREKLSQRWESAVASQAKAYNQKHKPKTFNKDDLVLLSTKNLNQKRPFKKLSHKFAGPFRIAEPIGKQAYRLHLPATYQIHNVFHVSYLEPYRRKEDNSETPYLPAPELIDEGEEYEVEEILGK